MRSRRSTITLSRRDVRGDRASRARQRYTRTPRPTMVSVGGSPTIVTVGALWSGGAVARPLNPRLARAVRAAEEAAVGLDAVTHDLAVTVLALRRHLVDRALEAVEHVPLAASQDLEGLVVVVAADGASAHDLPPGRSRWLPGLRLGESGDA